MPRSNLDGNQSGASHALIDRSMKGKNLLSFLVIALLAGYWALRDARTPEVAEPPPQKSEEADFPDSQTVEIERCVDGDTLIARKDGRRWRVRLIGCNTPETVKEGTPVEPFGPEASAYTKKRIAEFSDEVTLIRDGDRVDQYGRRLALVFLGSDREHLLNEELIRLGLARATLQYRFSDAQKDVFRKAEKEAKKEKRGIWGQ